MTVSLESLLRTMLLVLPVFDGLSCFVAIFGPIQSVSAVFTRFTHSQLFLAVYFFSFLFLLFFFLLFLCVSSWFACIFQASVVFSAFRHFWMFSAEFFAFFFSLQPFLLVFLRVQSLSAHLVALANFTDIQLILVVFCRF